MSVLDRTALEASPLADLHAIASELSIDGYRRLRRAALIDAILDKQEGAAPRAVDDGEPPKRERAASRVRDEDESPKRERAASRAGDEDEPAKREGVASRAGDEDEPAKQQDDEEERATTRRRRGRRGGRGRTGARPAEAEADAEASAEADAEARAEADAEARAEADAGADAPREDDESRDLAAEVPAPEEAGAQADRGSGDEELVDGVVELLANGSGFVRVQPPDPSDEDVYISAAQVKRCELVSGDRITGPKRAPRRSERFASLVRIETINNRPASELADSVRFDDLPAVFPDERLTLDSEDPTLKAIDWLTPFGKGSRVTIVGAARAGKSHTLKQIADVLGRREDLSLQVVLAGVRPEEISEWGQDGVAPVAALSFAASEDALNGVVDPVIDQARRLAARGADAVVLIDSLDGSSPQTARKALASARNIVDGGSLTVIATASAPIGGETTVIALDHDLTSVARFPAIDIFASGTIRAELLVGTEGAAAIARMRVEASEIAAE
jgi:transcription termination factor Rho